MKRILQGGLVFALSFFLWTVWKTDIVSKDNPFKSGSITGSHKLFSPKSSDSIALTTNKSYGPKVSKMSTFESSYVEKEKQIDEYFDVSGIEKQLLNMDNVVEKNIENLRSKLDLNEEEFEELQKNIKSHINAQKILASIRKTLDQNLNSKELKELVDLYNSPLLKKLVELEGLSSYSEGPDDKGEFLEYIKKNPLKEDRFELLNTLDTVVKGTKASVILMSEFYRGVQDGFNSILPEEKRARRKTLNDEFKDIKTELTKSLKGMVVQSLHYLYKDLSNNDIQKYIDINQGNKILKRVHPLYLEGIRNAFPQLKKL